MSGFTGILTALNRGVSFGLTDRTIHAGVSSNAYAHMQYAFLPNAGGATESYGAGDSIQVDRPNEFVIGASAADGLDGFDPTLYQISFTALSGSPTLGDGSWRNAGNYPAGFTIPQTAPASCSVLVQIRDKNTLAVLDSCTITCIVP